MKIKTKKRVSARRIVRVDASGEIKEILIKEDFMKPKEISIEICYRGDNSSGIVELSADEIESISKKIEPKLHELGKVKVLKFKK